MRLAWNWMLALCCGAIARAEVIYVDDTASGANDGSNWADAYVSLVDALSAARFGDQVWVAAGRYTPDPTPPYSRTATFAINDAIAIYGGFAGTESSLGERAGLFDQTELSGDLAGDDVAPFANVAENSFHVVSIAADSPVRIDGFRIVGGNADQSTPPHRDGGGVWAEDANGVTFANCLVEHNRASQYGGGIHARNVGAVVIEECRFVGNVTFNGATSGGAVFVRDSTALVAHCEFVENVVGSIWLKGSISRGGALCFFGSPSSIVDSVFRANAALGSHSHPGMGGAVYSSANLEIEGSFFLDNRVGDYDGWGGAVRTEGGPTTKLIAKHCRFVGNVSVGNAASGGAIEAYSKVELVHCFFAGNETHDDYDVAYGGAIAAFPSLVAHGCVFAANVAGVGSAVDGGSSTIVQCTFSKNVAIQPTSQGAAAFFSNNGPNVIRNSIFHDNRWLNSSSQSAQVQGTQLSLARNCIDGWNGTLGGIGNFDADPMFVDIDGPDGDFGTDDDDLRLSPGSPCLEAGDNALLPNDLADLDSDGIVNEPLPLDLDLGPRVWLSHVASPTGVGGPPIVDLGAYERHGDVCQSSVGYQGPGNLTLALCGEDLTQPDAHATLFVTEAPPSGSVWLVVGPALSAVPLFGGVLAPAPILATFVLPIDATGKAVLPISNRNSGPPIEWYLQGVAMNGASVAFSNALEVLVAGP